MSTNGYHAGLGYTREQQHELDALFSTYIRRDQYAEAVGYENDLLNTAAEAILGIHRSPMTIVNGSPGYPHRRPQPRAL